LRAPHNARSATTSLVGVGGIAVGEGDGIATQQPHDFSLPQSRRSNDPPSKSQPALFGTHVPPLLAHFKLSTKDRFLQEIDDVGAGVDTLLLQGLDIGAGVSVILEDPSSCAEAQHAASTQNSTTNRIKMRAGGRRWRRPRTHDE